LRAPHISLRGIGKAFGGIEALVGVDLDIAHGSIHALVGENGAGKSTLGKIIAGAVVPDDGELAVDGRQVSYRSPRAALRDGLTIMAQELALLPRRSVLENVFLGVEDSRGGFITERAARRRFEELSQRVGFDLSPGALVGTLRVADQQKVEILRALARDSRLIVMDEPTAALTRDAAEKLFDVVRALRKGGTTIVYVSHFLDEVLALADTVTVLKDGRLVRTGPASAETSESLVTAMLGRSLEVTFPSMKPPAPDAPVVFSVEGLRRAELLEPVSFEIRAGEILGLAGLIGSGRTEIARAIFGADRSSCEEMTLDGAPLRIRRPGDAVKAGVALLPESRKEQGLVLSRSTVENMSLAHLNEVSRLGWVGRSQEAGRTADLIERLEITAGRTSGSVSRLSGGNQQKVLFAKWLFRPPRLLIADEPTRGVDIGAKRAIYDLIHDLAGRGMAVLLISSEQEEVMGLAHRVLVMRLGAVAADLTGSEINEKAIMTAAFAVTDGGNR
jgi:ABC-type sugar transport system ATPase subunit